MINEQLPLAEPHSKPKTLKNEKQDKRVLALKEYAYVRSFF